MRDWDIGQDSGPMANREGARAAGGKTDQILNDEERWPFDRIADWIEENVP